MHCTSPHTLILISRMRSRLGVNGWNGHIHPPAIATDGTAWIPNNQRVLFGSWVDASPILRSPHASPSAVINGSGSLIYPYILVIQTVP
ncbi:hypothetical protein [Laspinema olomoucense]|uniref:hypothetical protein n=1 Tax=Laspinema olomoucense TaxID=3231600 RepID=UPI0021BA5214|nr:hypothetical protein [Laspinema sp. D3d]MCT7971559.1 hypothetical protein [Laspinema sp. D3d]